MATNKKGAGRPAGYEKTGGRQKGTPNKDNPIKPYLRDHSLKYFQPNPKNPDGISDFDLDCMAVTDPADRINIELRLLKFHTAEMKAVEMDVTADVKIDTLSKILAELDDNTVTV